MNLADFHFIRPYWLLAVIPYMLILVLMLRNKLNQGNWSAVCDAALLPYILQEKAARQSRWPLTAGAIAALLVIIALAGPTWERLPSPVFRNDSAIVIALDLSRSMDAADIKPSRLIRARYKIADILKQRKDGQTALLVYAGDAFTVTPLTDDTETIASQLEALNTDIMPSQGSDTKLALEKAVELLKQAGLQKGQILLVTDGVDMNKTLDTVKSLDKYQLSILGVGTDDGAPIALPEGGFLKDEQGNIVVPKLNSHELTKLAQAGNGVYQTITANDADIQTVLAALDKLVQQQGKENTSLLLEQWADKGPWLLLLVLPLAALSFRKGLLCFALLLILPLPKNSYAFDWQDLWQTKDQQAQQAFNKQDYAKAAAQFENPNWKAAAHYKAGEYGKALENLKNSKSASSAYNQGNALAQAGQLEQALKAYEKALGLNPNDSDAKTNKDIVEKELEKQKQNKQNQQKDDKQQSKGDSQQSKDGEQSEKSDEQKKAEEKSEQKPEQKQSDKQQSAENQDQQNRPEEKKPEAEKPQQAEQKEDQAKEQPKEQLQEQAPANAQPTDEQQQANEQWLNRIPDDPAGLLKRKFKYQYGQRGRQSGSNVEAW
ncbi:MAG: VWA domain-containing protein [Methylobacter sp.]|jgi:Ca-activated chloride channel family protein